MNVCAAATSSDQSELVLLFCLVQLLVCSSLISGSASLVSASASFEDFLLPDSVRGSLCVCTRKDVGMGVLPAVF